MSSHKRALHMIADRSGRAAKKRPEYLSVRDLERFQHYKNRCPPWVKLYWSILDDPAYLGLSEVDRHRYMMAILIASRVENKILNDGDYLAKLMRLSDPVDLTALIDSGLLLAWCKPSASSPLAARKQNALSEKRRGEESQRRGGPGEHADQKMVVMEEERNSINVGGSSEKSETASRPRDGFEPVGGIQAEILKRQGLL